MLEKQRFLLNGRHFWPSKWDRNLKRLRPTLVRSWMQLQLMSSPCFSPSLASLPWETPAEHLFPNRLKKKKKRFTTERHGVHYWLNLKLKFTCGYKHSRSLSHRYNYAFLHFCFSVFCHMVVQHLTAVIYREQYNSPPATRKGLNEIQQLSTILHKSSGQELKSHVTWWAVKNKQRIISPTWRLVKKY